MNKTVSKSAKPKKGPSVATCNQKNERFEILSPAPASTLLISRSLLLLTCRSRGQVKEHLHQFISLSGN